VSQQTEQAAEVGRFLSHLPGCQFLVLVMQNDDASLTSGWYSAVENDCFSIVGSWKFQACHFYAALKKYTDHKNAKYAAEICGNH